MPAIESQARTLRECDFCDFANFRKILRNFSVPLRREPVKELGDETPRLNFSARGIYSAQKEMAARDDRDRRKWPRRSFSARARRAGGSDRSL